MGMGRIGTSKEFERHEATQARPLEIPGEILIS